MPKSCGYVKAFHDHCNLLKRLFLAQLVLCHLVFCRSINRNWRGWPTWGKSLSRTSRVSLTSLSCPTWPGVSPHSPRPGTSSPPTEEVVSLTNCPPAPPHPNPTPRLIHKMLLAVSSWTTRVVKLAGWKGGRDIRMKVWWNQNALQRRTETLSAGFFHHLLLDEDSTPPAWKEFVSFFLIFFF